MQWRGLWLVAIATIANGTVHMDANIIDRIEITDRIECSQWHSQGKAWLGCAHPTPRKQIRMF